MPALAPIAKMEEGLITDHALESFRRRIGAKLRIPNQFNETASRDAIRKFADGIGDANPLWRNPAYAEKTIYRSITAPPSWLNSVFPTWVLQGLPGVHAIQTSTEWEFFRPVLLDDQITPECFFTGFDIKESRFAGRSVIERQTARYWNQKGELVAEARPTGLRCERPSARSNGKYSKLELPHPWTEEQLREIERQVINEKIRGARVRFWEDTTENENLPTLTKGPLGLTDIIAYCVGASPVQLQAHGLALRQYKNHPAWAFRDPDTFALEPIYGVHYNKAAANAIGLPYPYDAAVQRNCWLIQLLTNWIGDPGWIKQSYVEYRGFVYLSDVVKLQGRATKKYRDENGEYCLDIKTRALNQRGEDVMPGASTVILPSKTDNSGPLDRRLNR